MTGIRLREESWLRMRAGRWVRMWVEKRLKGGWTGEDSRAVFQIVLWCGGVDGVAAKSG